MVGGDTAGTIVVQVGGGAERGASIAAGPRGDVDGALDPLPLFGPGDEEPGMGLPLIQVDAFTDTPFAGNPAAVCLLDGARDDAWLQAVGAEMNLPETAFLTAAADGFGVRSWIAAHSGGRRGAAHPATAEASSAARHHGRRIRMRGIVTPA